MKILHLSDLHLTGENRTFDDVWDGPRATIGAQRFDVIVVSGDLSQRAGVAEYEALERFLRDELLALIDDAHSADEKRRRVVLVPGNHDVDWSAPIGQVFSLTQRVERDGADRVRDMLRSARSAPERSAVREIVGQLGQSEFLEIDQAKYPDRFENVQAFFDRVYEDDLGEEDHRFALVGPERDHWSAHVFHEEGVAFYGFNSCDRNDRYWTGASFSSAAVNAAARHADAHARGLLRVAVWHHGLGSERGRRRRGALPPLRATRRLAPPRRRQREAHLPPRDRGARPASAPVSLGDLGADHATRRRGARRRQPRERRR